MTSARALTCPSCGAGVAEGARVCAHCGSPLATVRCANCYQMNASDAAYCSGCGRELGLEPIPRQGPALECPDCRVAMTPVDCGPGVLHDCGRCGGQFVEHAALRDLLERHDRNDVGERRAPANLGPIEVRVRYVPCPVCRAMMNRRNFGAGSGVVIDVCALHGTWFDARELPRVLSFVESGGLQRARRHEAEEKDKLAQELYRQRMADATAPMQHLHLSRDMDDRSDLSAAVNLIVTLFRD